MKQDAPDSLAQILRAFFFATPDAVIFVDREGKVASANPPACHLLGYTLDQLQSGGVGLFLRAQDVSQALRETAPKSQQNTCCAEYQLKRADGSLIWAEMSACALPPEEDGLMAWVLRDVTGRKEREATTITRAKLDAVSTMSGGMAHDWNNILCIIMGNLDLAESKCRPEDPVAPMLRSASRAAAEARELVFKFLCFARSALQEVTTIHTESLVQNACRMALSDKPVSGQVHCENGVWSLKGDPELLHTALLNILENARAASPVGGQIHVRVQNVHIERGEDAGAPQLNPGRYVRIDVQDQGPGIPPEIIDRVFDPYFSTKPRGTQKGKGMSLAVAWGIVQSHGGHIRVASQEHKGTTVTLYLPAAAEASSVKTGLVDIEGPLRAKIQVMDDEPMLRQLAEDVMEHLGYECETARHGKEAVAKYRDAMEKGTPF